MSKLEVIALEIIVTILVMLLYNILIKEVSVNEREY